MFVTIKALIAYMDNNIKYVTDAKEHHECSEREYKEYMENMRQMLDGQLTRLKSMSSNKKLIKRYEDIINSLF